MHSRPDLTDVGKSTGKQYLGPLVDRVGVVGGERRFHE